MQKYAVTFADRDAATIRVDSFRNQHRATAFFAFARALGFGPDAASPEAAVSALIGQFGLTAQTIAPAPLDEHDDPTSCEYQGLTLADLDMQDETARRAQAAHDAAEEAAMIAHHEAMDEPDRARLFRSAPVLFRSAPQGEITVRYRSVDRVGETRRFKTLAGAQKYAHRRVGQHPEVGGHYAVSGDGIGKITVQGCTLSQLFPEAA